MENKVIEVKIPKEYIRNTEILEQIYLNIIPYEITTNLIGDNNICAMVKDSSTIDFSDKIYDIEVIDNNVKFITKPQMFNHGINNDNGTFDVIYKKEFAKTGFYDNFKSHVYRSDIIISEIDELLKLDNVLTTWLPIFKYYDKTYSIDQHLNKDEIMEVINNNRVVIIYRVDKPMSFHDKVPIYRCSVINKEIIKE